MCRGDVMFELVWQAQEPEAAGAQRQPGRRGEAAAPARRPGPRLHPLRGGARHHAPRARTQRTWAP